MELKLWKNFKKRINSTKQPADADATVMNVVFKSDTSIENPVLLIKGIDMDYNYCKLASHYYYIDDIVLVNNDMYELHCIQDTLATFKADISNTSAYIKLASNGPEFNNMIYDNRIGHYVSRKQVIEYSGVNVMRNTVPFYAFSVINIDSTCISTYILNPTQLRQVAAYLFTDNPVIKFLREMGGINSMLIALRALPLTDDLYNRISSQSLYEAVDCQIFIGEFPLGTIRAICRLKDDAIIKSAATIPLVWNYNDFRRIDEFVKVYLPCYGMLDIPTASIIDASAIRINFNINPTLGKISYILEGNRVSEGEVLSNSFIGEYEGDYGYEIPIKARNTDIMSGITGLLSSASTLTNAFSYTTKEVVVQKANKKKGLKKETATERELGDSPVGIGSDLLKLVQAPPTTIGSLGDANVLNKFLDLRLYVCAGDYNTEPSNLWTLYGRPVEKVDVIGNYSGFIKCEGASVNIAGLGSDKDTVNSYLDSGFYYE